jgi:hypothetical protein
MTIKHYEQVDHERIQAEFYADRRHRATLRVPFMGRAGTRTLCVIGQNPSAADEHQADKTIQFLERYVFHEQRAYAQMLMLNLYSRVDTRKSETTDLDHSDCVRAFRKAISENQDFLVVFGKLCNKGAYKFRERARDLKPLLAGKNVYKFDIGVGYAPHPGNTEILYHDLTLQVDPIRLQRRLRRLGRNH